MDRFRQIGVIKNRLDFDDGKLDYFKKRIRTLRDQKSWKKKDIMDLFLKLIPNFRHKETGIYLDSKM